jgi:hypothetical protein
MADAKSGAEEEVKPTECDCCHYEPVEVTRYTSQFPREPGVAWYCDLCAGTITSRIASGSEDYARKEILKVICYVGNAALAAIKAKQ